MSRKQEVTKGPLAVVELELATPIAANFKLLENRCETYSAFLANLPIAAGSSSVTSSLTVCTVTKFENSKTRMVSSGLRLSDFTERTRSFGFAFN